MIHINEQRLESDLSYRFQYLVEFIGFSEEDVAAIHGAAPAIAPLVPTLVNAVYDKLERTLEVRTLRAFNKLLWLQNDLINRHYQEAKLARASS